MKKRLTRLVSLVLALVMMSAAFCIPAYAKSKTITINFEMERADKRTFVYDDAFFNNSSYNFSIDLARVTCGVAAASSLKDNITDFSKKAGFKKLYLSPEIKNATSEVDTIGTVCMQKKASDSKGKYTLVLLSNRGSNYYSEWGGNAVGGASGDHENFTMAKNTSLKRLKKYLKDTGVKGRIKLWVTGYSRSASIANMIGGALDDGYDLGSNVSLARSDLFVYTYEAPRCVMASKVKNKKYDNIKNLVNSADLVQVIPFKTWGFVRYGKDYVYPTKADPNYRKYEIKFLKDFTKDYDPLCTTYWPDFFQAYTVKKVGNTPVYAPASMTAEEYLPKLEYAMTHYLVSSRKEYADKLQGPLSVALADLKDEDFSDNAKAGVAIFAEKLQDNWKDVMAALLSSDEKATDLVLEYLADSFIEAGATSADAASIKKAIRTIVPMLGRMAKKDPGTTATLIANILPLVGGHFAGAGMSWLLTLPDSYMGKHSAYSWK